MRFDFSGKVVLVTGASGGIGWSIASAFASAGARVIFHYYSSYAKAARLFAQLDGQGHVLFSMNLLETDEVAKNMQRLLAEVPVVDVLVNNAGIFERHVVDDISFGDWCVAWERALRVNLLGPAHLIYSLLPSMQANGGGKIINITSRGAFRGEPEAPAYGASKAGLNALSQSLAKRLAPQGIHVYAVAPGFTDTERVAPVLGANRHLLEEIPLGRVATPDEVARTVLFLADTGQDSLTGGIIDINGASYLR